jgi:hypothetical protein
MPNHADGTGCVHGNEIAESSTLDQIGDPRNFLRGVIGVVLPKEMHLASRWRELGEFCEIRRGDRHGCNTDDAHRAFAERMRKNNERAELIPEM